MEQVNNGAALDIFQAMAAQTQLPKAGGRADGDSDFRKLMDKAASGREAPAEEPSESPRAEKVPAGRSEKVPVQKPENPLERIRRLLEEGWVGLQPVIPIVMPNGQMYRPEEYVEIRTELSAEFIPVTELDDAQLGQLRQLLDSMASVQTADVEDPEADAMLEATDPTVDHSPAALLEKVAAEQFGRAAGDAVEAVRPEAEERQGDEPMMEAEVTDAQQAPQPLFHDVKAAQVNVGEVDRAPETEKADVVRQVDNGVALAMEKGESMVRIQLSPENLGSITVEITRSAEGIIRVALNAHSGETRGLLERHAGELQGLLSGRTQQSVEVNVQRQQESQQNHNHNYDGHNGHARDGEQQHQRRQQEQSDSVDFIQQLRLGLIPVEE